MVIGPFGPAMVALCCGLPSYTIEKFIEVTAPGEYLSPSVGDTIGPPCPSFKAGQNGSASALASIDLDFEPCLPSP